MKWITAFMYFEMVSMPYYIPLLKFSIYCPQVHCISTEFTPKKHGGERGVPFRLQIETFSSEAGHCRLHAGACILQVFKLKGADRKHKQDRDKISKRPVSVQ